MLDGKHLAVVVPVDVPQISVIVNRIEEIRKKLESGNATGRVG